MSDCGTSKRSLALSINYTLNDKISSLLFYSIKSLYLPRLQEGSVMLFLSSESIELNKSIY